MDGPRSWLVGEPCARRRRGRRAGVAPRATRFDPGLEPLEGRALLASFEIAGSGGISGVASVDSRSDTDFVSLGTSPIALEPPLVDVNMDLADGGLGGAASGKLSYQFQADDQAGTATATLTLAAFAQSHPSDDTSAGEVESELGTSLGGNPGEWITVDVTPTGSEEPGDPVLIELEGVGTGSGVGHPGVDSRWEILYDAGDGQGEQVLVAGNHPGGSALVYGSRNVQLASRVGESLRLRIDASSRGQAQGQPMAQIANGTAAVRLTLKVRPAPRPDLVVTALSWNPKQGGVDFRYEVKDAELTADATIALYWAKGAVLSASSKPIQTWAVSRKVGSYGPFNVPGRLLGEPPAGATHLLMVIDPGKKVAESREDNNARALLDVQVGFGGNANRKAVSAHTLGVLKGVLREAGQPRAIISSTLRTPADQARIMFDNLVGTKAGQGVVAQKKLYGSHGDRVIDEFTRVTRGKSQAQILAMAPQVKKAMETKIRQLGPSNVSRHCGDPKVLGVIDVAPSSLANRAKFSAVVKSRTPRPISKYIPYPADPGEHLEIPQPKSPPSTPML